MSGAASAVVIGIGNEFRRDDGVGPALVALLAEDAPEDVRLLVSDGEPTRLIEAWDGASVAIVIDAARVDSPTPGRFRRTEAADLTDRPSASTHGLGVLDALRLAEAVGRAPQRLVVFAVDVAEVGHGTGLGPAVTAALAPLADAVRAELGP